MRALSILFILLPFSIFGQSYFQQEVNHTIKVKLNDKNHTLSAFEEIEYKNNSSVDLDTIYMHLWPNAYQSTFSALGRQKMEDGDLDMHFSDSIDKGFIDSLDFKINGTSVGYSSYQDHLDIAIIVLPNPLKAGESITITTPFRVKIPNASFSRLGHVGESYMITQWFPKPAVFDKDGWHPIPYLNQGEFYSEFGSYDVTVTLPDNYVVGSTGDLKTQSELDFLNDLNISTRNKIEKKNLVTLNKAGFVSNKIPASSETFKTLRYTQSNIHDFAWFADKRFHVLKSSVDLPRHDRTVTSWAMFTDKEAHLWKNASTYLDSAIYYYSLWNGDYPYNQVTAVDGTIAAGGGMEYPNVTVIGGSGSAFLLEQVIVHEVGHNWFYGILGSNERDHPWMDEGLNSLNENRYIETRYPNANLTIMAGGFKKIASKFGIDKLKTKSIHEYSYLLNARRNLDQPIEHKSVDYTSSNYGGVVYSKTAIVFDYLLAYLGDSLFDHCMRTYYDEWHFKHPGPDDLRQIFEKETGKQLSWMFDDLIKTTKKIDYAITGMKKLNGKDQVVVQNKGDVQGPFSLTYFKDGEIVKTFWDDGLNMISYHPIDKELIDEVKIDYELDIPEINRTNNNLHVKGLFKTSEPITLQLLGGIEDPEQNTLYYTPVGGWNKYDGLMLGFSFYNHTFPEKKFEYTLTPLFSLGTLTPTGMGDVHYHMYPSERNFIQRLTLGSEYQTFHFHKEEAGTGRFHKLAPYLEIDFQKKKRRSKWKQTARINYNFISEIINLDNATFPADYIQALRVGYKLSNSQVLKPFSVNLDYEQGNLSNDFSGNQQYIKASLTAKWRINYNWNLDGIDLRFFAGHFFKNTSSSSRLNWKLAGQGGTSDYLYDHIFLGRTQSHPDALAQQLVENHGAFKAPTGYGSSNSWLIAGNIKVDLPIPILGLYADAGLFPVHIVSTGEIEKRFLYNVGVHLSIKKDLFDIYIPFALHEDLSGEYEFKNISFLQRIRFTFNIKELNPFKAIKQLDL
jgi:hypothetical protein